jgi:guanylate kinase
LNSAPSNLADKADRRGLLFVLSSPSGTGKTSISRAMLAADPQISISISYTTRPPRPREHHGEHYFFVDEAEFLRRIDQGFFLEHAHVHGNRYGTPRDFVEAQIAAGRDVLFDIDWQGAQQLAQSPLKDDLVRVFLLPPSAAALEARLRGRAQDSDEVIARRLAKAADEISHWAEYDYVVVNREFNAALAEVQFILAVERKRRARQIGIVDFAETLVRELNALTKR